MEQHPVEDHMSSKILQLLATVYGPYAFGVASLLLIWFTIVAPQLERQSVDFQKNESVIESLRSVAASMETISRSMERTATILDTVVQKVQVNAVNNGP
jgi:hypothetical protein